VSDVPTQVRWRETLGVVAFTAVAVLVGFPVAWSDPSGWSTVVYAVAVVVLIDVGLVYLAATRASRRTALLCVAVALGAALVQAVWVAIPFFWNVLPPFSDGVLWFASGPVVALMVTVGLFVRRPSRRYGLAVLVGSAEGFIGMFVLLALALAAAMGAD
jgi:hypothetical protein